MLAAASNKASEALSHMPSSQRWGCPVRHITLTSANPDPTLHTPHATPEPQTRTPERQITFISGDTSVGSDNDRALTSILGDNWRELTQQDAPVWEDGCSRYDPPSSRQPLPPTRTLACFPSPSNRPHVARPLPSASISLFLCFLPAFHAAHARATLCVCAPVCLCVGSAASGVTNTRQRGQERCRKNPTG